MKPLFLVAFSASLVLAPAIADSDSDAFYGLSAQQQLQTIPHGCEIQLQTGLTEVAHTVQAPAAQVGILDDEAQSIVNDLESKLKSSGYQGGVEYREHGDQVGGGARNGVLFINILWTASAIGVNVQCKSHN